MFQSVAYYSDSIYNAQKKLHDRDRAYQIQQRHVLILSIGPMYQLKGLLNTVNKLLDEQNESAPLACAIPSHSNNATKETHV
jgi:hypothetical protein